MNEQLADLQAQVVALRFAVEGAWLSLLQPDPNPMAAARRLGELNVAAVEELKARNAGAEAIHAAVLHHTQQLWGSIVWQLENGAATPA